MRIGLNLLHFHQGIGGVWNYVENLLSALGRFDRNNTYIVFLTPHCRCLVPDQENFIPVTVSLDPRKTGLRVLFENTALHFLAVKYRIDCLHWFANVVSPFSLVPAVVTIHDLLPLRRPRAYSPLKQFYLKLMLRLTALRADAVLPISRTTELDVKQRLKPRTKRFHVLPVILDAGFKRATEDRAAAFRDTYGLPEHFWLYVAHLYPHKNHLRLIRAYAAMKETVQHPWPLVLRGDCGSDSGETGAAVAREIETLGLTGDVIRLGRLDYEELPLLYTSASALVFPSLFEGGGIPVLEAMACGCPVAASGIDVVKEFTGGAALIFDGNDVRSIADRMARLQNNEDFRNRLILRGCIRTAGFSGSRVIGTLVKAYQEVVENGSSRHIKKM